MPTAALKFLKRDAHHFDLVFQALPIRLIEPAPPERRAKEVPGSIAAKTVTAYGADPSESSPDTFPNTMAALPHELLRNHVETHHDVWSIIVSDNLQTQRCQRLLHQGRFWNPIVVSPHEWIFHSP
jgi:hypothetical protein